MYVSCLYVTQVNTNWAQHSTCSNATSKYIDTLSEEYRTENRSVSCIWVWFRWPVAFYFTLDVQLWVTLSAAVFVAEGCSGVEVQSLWTGGKASSFSPEGAHPGHSVSAYRPSKDENKNGRESENKPHTAWRFVLLTPVSWLSDDSGLLSLQKWIYPYVTKSADMS